MLYKKGPHIIYSELSVICLVSSTKPCILTDYVSQSLVYQLCFTKPCILTNWLCFTKHCILACHVCFALLRRRRELMMMMKMRMKTLTQQMMSQVTSRAVLRRTRNLTGMKRRVRKVRSSTQTRRVVKTGVTWRRKLEKVHNTSSTPCLSCC